LRQLHPLRLQSQLFSDANPLMASVQASADRAREERKPVAADNPFLQFEQAASRQIVATLDAWRDMSEMWAERTFLTVFGSPMLQAAVGIDPADTRPPRKAGKTPLHRELLQARIDDLRSRIPTGGLLECLARSLLYVGMARGSADERGFAAIRRLRSVKDDRPALTLAEFKALVREQYFMLLIDQEAALGAIPGMLPADEGARRKGLAALYKVLSARGEIAGSVAERLREIARLFGIEAGLAIAAPAESLVELSKAS